MITLYGIPNCDTVRKARRWLDEHGVAYDFHDLRADGLERSQVAAWLDALGHEQLINRRSSSWRSVPAAEREALDDARAIALVLEQPTLIRRPLLECGGEVHVGFSAARYQALLA